MKHDSEKLSPPTASPRPLRLLYVESHWLSRKVVWYLMQDVDCTWTYADNAAQAVALSEKSKAECTPFDVVIVDHDQTAEGSGLRVARTLRQAGCKDTILAIASMKSPPSKNSATKNSTCPSSCSLPKTPPTSRRLCERR